MIDPQTLAMLIPADVKKDHQLLIEAAVKIAERDGTIRDALTHAGYTETTASLGMAGCPKFLKEMVAAAMVERGKEYAAIGKRIDPAHVENAISGKLYSAMVTGDENGINAAKLLGTMRRYSAFEKDSQVGVIVLSAPTLQPAGKPLRAVDEYDTLQGELVENPQLGKIE